MLCFNGCTATPDVMIFCLLYPHCACNAVLHLAEDAVLAMTGPGGVAPAPTGAGGALPLLLAVAAAALLLTAAAAPPLSDAPLPGKPCTHGLMQSAM